ncbi:unnamed protein product [Adineta ricciae]|uniref:Uncharacterized protein n=1 Tax=Adineta ricciae TaxID=249248 RepID=A0A815UJ92_ADIRI|nr:unnamed protein product [Adineta ricciae]
MAGSCVFGEVITIITVVFWGGVCTAETVRRGNGNSMIRMDTIAERERERDVAYNIAPSFIQRKCKVGATELSIEWKPFKNGTSVTGYVVEIEENTNTCREVYRVWDAISSAEITKEHTLFFTSICMYW